MIISTKRKLTAKELKQLKRQKRGEFYSAIESSVLAYIFIMSVLLLPLLYIDKYYPIPSWIQGITSIVILIIAFFITRYILWSAPFFGRHPNEKSLSKVEAEVLYVKTARAIMREDPEDFGPAFYFDIREADSPPKVLFLWGQYLYEESFPNTEFEIIRRSDTKELINLISHGDYFEPERTLPPFSDKIFSEGTYPEDGTILDMSLDAIRS